MSHSLRFACLFFPVIWFVLTWFVPLFAYVSLFLRVAYVAYVPVLWFALTLVVPQFAYVSLFLLFAYVVAFLYFGLAWLWLPLSLLVCRFALGLLMYFVSFTLVGLELGCPSVCLRVAFLRFAYVDSFVYFGLLWFRLPLGLLMCCLCVAFPSFCLCSFFRVLWFALTLVVPQFAYVSLFLWVTKLIDTSDRENWSHIPAREPWQWNKTH